MHKRVDNRSHAALACGIESVQGFVENQQVGVLDERACNQHHPLLTCRQCGVTPVGK